MSNAHVMISLKSPATAQAAVNWQTTDGTAVAGTDYTTSSGTVYFNAGESTKMIEIPVLNTTSGTIKFFNVMISTTSTIIEISESICRVLLVPQKIITAGISTGIKGDPGESAYQVAVDAGYTGTQAEWLASLVGQQGPAGPQGDKGDKGNTGDTGPQGVQGVQGVQGNAGPSGTNGKSAYEIAVQDGFSGTEAEWLVSLKGATGSTGAKGDKGDTGSTGPQGLQGEKGDTGEQGIKGDTGDQGENAYQVAVNNGFTGTESEWLASLKGETGDKGDKGDMGNSFQVNATGTTSERAQYDAQPAEFSFLDTSTGMLYFKNSDTTGDWSAGIQFKGDKGDTGATGPQGDDGISAYQVAVDNGFTGTEAEWLASLKGAKGDTGDVGPKGDTGAQGIQGEQGPAGATGAKGDTGAQGIQGEQGIQGIQGVAGDNGTDGATWYSGTSAPSASTGADGDFYLNTSTYDVYKKASGAWAVSLNIKGATGTTGTAGTNGSVWYSGSTVPASATGTNGDYYLYTTTYDVYKKSSDAWSILLNIKGATGSTGAKGDKGDTGATGDQGPQGVQGVQGIQGQQGTNGSTWYSGTAVPDNSTGVDGDYYFYGSTGDVYNKSAGVWAVFANIKGKDADISSILSSDNTWTGTQTFNTPIAITSGGTGNTTGLAASAKVLATARTLRTNLASTSTVSFDGSSNVTPGVTGTLPIANGGTGNTTGLAASATKLATARSVLIDLTSTTAGSFDGTANITPGVSGALSLANGGTGSTVAITAAYNIGALPIRGQVTSTGVALNTFGPTSDYVGIWYFTSSSQLTGSTNLPESMTGILEVHNGGRYNCTQKYITALGTLYVRTLLAAWDAASPTWGDWYRVGDQPVQGYISDDLNNVITPGTYSIASTATNIPAAYTGIMEVKLRLSTNSVVQRFTIVGTSSSLTARTYTRTLSGTTWSSWLEAYSSLNKPSVSDLGAVSISGDTMTGTLNGTAATYSGTVTGREVNTTYRITQSRTDANPSYITWNRVDQVNGTLPSSITQVGFLQAMLTGTDGNLYDRSLGQLSFWYDTNGGGVAYLGARNASASTTSQIKLDGVNALATITGNLSATGTIDRTGSGTLGFNANRTNSNANSYYGAQTTAGQIFFGTGSGLNFVVNNAQSNSGAWLTMDGSSASFSGAISAPSLSLTTSLPVSSGGTGASTAAAALIALGAAAKGANSDITSLTGLTTALSIAQGGTGNTIGLAVSASKLATARTFTTNLASTTAGSFDGSANNTHGVTGTLPVANGGTGVTDLTSLRNNMGLGSSSVPNFTSVELFGATPYIDFHYGSTSDDFNVRLINDSTGVLSLGGGRLDVGQGYCIKGGINAARGGSVFNILWQSGTGVTVWIDSTNMGVVNFTATSDKGLKKDIEYVTDNPSALDEVLQWKPASFKYKARGIIEESDSKLGFIANDLVTASPECVTGEGLPDDYDIEADPNNQNAYQLDQIAMIAKLTMALQEQNKLIQQLQAQINSSTGTSSS